MSKHSSRTRRSVRLTRGLGSALAMAFAAMASCSAHAATGTWVTGATGNWSDSTNWTGVVPSAAGDTATYSPDTAATTLLDTNETIGFLNYGGRGLWTIASNGTNALTMNASTVPASITISNRGSMVVNPNIVLGDAANGLQLLASSSSGVGTLTLNGSITGTGPVTINTSLSNAAASGVTVNGALNNTGEVIITGTNANQFATLMNVGPNVTKLTKTGASTLNLGSSYTLTGASGTGTIGDATNAMTLGLLTGGKLTVTNGTGAVSNKVTARLTGGELAYSGAGSDVIAALNGGTGGTVTVDTNGGGNTASLTAGTWAAPTTGVVLFRGTNMGSAPGAGVGSIFFTTAPTLSGSGSAGTNTVGTIAHAYGDASATGSGTGFVTYDAIKGVRLLDTATEYATNSFTSGANVLINSTTNLGAATTVNSLLIAGGSVTGANALTITSGDILVTGANTGLAANIVMGTGSTTYFNTLSDLTWSGKNVTSANANAVTNGNLVKNGSGTLNLTGLSSTNYYTGTTTINGGTVIFGGASALNMGSVTVNSGGTGKLNVNNMLSDGATLTVNSGGVFDFNGKSDAISILAGTGTVTSSTGTGSMTVNFGAATLTFGGNITGSLGINKRGTGTLILTGNNTYTGTTSVTAGGALQFANVMPSYNTAGKLAVVENTSALYVNAGLSGLGGWTSADIAALLSANSSAFANGSIFGIDTTNSGLEFTYGSDLAFTNSVGFTKLGTNTLKLTGNNTYAGKTAINQGTLSVSSISSNLGTNAAIDFTPAVNGNTATLQYTGTGETVTRSINLAGAANAINSIDQSGTGLLKFTAFSNGGAGSKTLNLTGSTSGVGEMAGSIVNNSGTNILTLTKTGTGSWVLSGANSYTGATTVSAGALILANNGALGTGAGAATSGVTVSSGASLQMQGDISTTTAVNLSLNGVGAASKGALENLSGSNTYSGAITLANNATIGSDAGLLTLTGGINNNGRALTFAGEGNTAVSSAISGNGTFIKTGSGVVTLGATNTYTGATTVSAGTLLINGSTAAGSAVSVASGATLGGSGTVGGATTVSGSLNPGNSPGLLSFSSSLTLNSSATTTMELAGSVRGTSYDGINVGTSLVYGGNLTLSFTSGFAEGDYTFNLFDFTSQSGNFSSVSLAGLYSGSLVNDAGVWSLSSGGNSWSFNQSTGDLSFSAVPEPGTTAMLALGLFGVVAFMRNVRKQGKLS